MISAAKRQAVTDRNPHLGAAWPSYPGAARRVCAAPKPADGSACRPSDCVQHCVGVTTKPESESDEGGRVPVRVQERVNRKADGGLDRGEKSGPAHGLGPSSLEPSGSKSGLWTSEGNLNNWPTKVPKSSSAPPSVSLPTDDHLARADPKQRDEAQEPSWSLALFLQEQPSAVTSEKRNPTRGSLMEGAVESPRRAAFEAWLVKACLEASGHQLSSNAATSCGDHRSLGSGNGTLGVPPPPSSFRRPHISNCSATGPQNFTTSATVSHNFNSSATGPHNASTATGFCGPHISPALLAATERQLASPSTVLCTGGLPNPVLPAGLTADLEALILKACLEEVGAQMPSSFDSWLAKVGSGESSLVGGSKRSTPPGSDVGASLGDGLGMGSLNGWELCSSSSGMEMGSGGRGDLDGYFSASSMFKKREGRGEREKREKWMAAGAVGGGEKDGYSSPALIFNLKKKERDSGGNGGMPSALGRSGVSVVQAQRPQFLREADADGSGHSGCSSYRSNSNSNSNSMEGYESSCSTVDMRSSYSASSSTSSTETLGPRRCTAGVLRSSNVVIFSPAASKQQRSVFWSVASALAYPWVAATAVASTAAETVGYALALFEDEEWGEGRGRGEIAGSPGADTDADVSTADAGGSDTDDSVQGFGRLFPKKGGEGEESVEGWVPGRPGGGKVLKGRQGSDRVQGGVAVGGSSKPRDSWEEVLRKRKASRGFNKFLEQTKGKLVANRLHIPEFDGAKVPLWKRRAFRMPAPIFMSHRRSICPPARPAPPKDGVEGAKADSTQSPIWQRRAVGPPTPLTMLRRKMPTSHGSGARPKLQLG